MSRLVDRIYECAFVPDLWPEILAKLAHIGGALSGWLCISNGSVLGWAASSEEARADLRPLMESGWITRSDRYNRQLRAKHAGFIPDHTLYSSLEEMSNDPAYKRMLYPRGMGWAAGTAFALPTGDDLLIALERAYDKGPPPAAVIDSLNAVHPHLARASVVAARMQMERARAAAQALALLGIPALVFSDNGKVLGANHLIEALNDFVLWRGGGRRAPRGGGGDRGARAGAAGGC